MKYGKVNTTSGRLQSVEIYEGETIEQKVNRIVNNNEPITDGAPIIFTERKDGVLPEYDIRTDRWDIAITAMDKVNTDKIARLQSVEIYEGETIEQKVNRITQNKEPITDSAPIIFTEIKDGVLPAYNIRTDRFDIALEAMDIIGRSKAERENAPILPSGGL